MQSTMSTTCSVVFSDRTNHYIQCLKCEWMVHHCSEGAREKGRDVLPLQSVVCFPLLCTSLLASELEGHLTYNAEQSLKSDKCEDQP